MHYSLKFLMFSPCTFLFFLAKTGKNYYIFSRKMPYFWQRTTSSCLWVPRCQRPGRTTFQTSRFSYDQYRAINMVHLLTYCNPRQKKLDEKIRPTFVKLSKSSIMDRRRCVTTMLRFRLRKLHKQSLIKFCR